ncbi:MAG: PKD domain-containing protein [Planctomycetota bacterium]|nr:MAG: PKD domain-containing protein [Planctomycetota bacterium]
MRVPARRARVRPLALLAIAALALPLRAQWPAHFEALPVGPAIQGVVGFAFAPSGSAIAWTKRGGVLVLHDGVPQSAPVVDLIAEVNNDWDRGLLGVALQPGFQPDGSEQSWIYLLYTVSPVYGQDVPVVPQGPYSFSRLTRYRVHAPGGQWQADPATRQVLLGNQLPDGSVPDAIASLSGTHSNGSLVFGSDGTLFVCAGEGAHDELVDTGGNDAPGFDNFLHAGTGKLGPTPAVEDSGTFRSQDLRSFAGKVLRIDPATGLGLASNPFYDGNPASHASRVWALGLRNPFRALLLPGSGSSDPTAGDPGELVVADVGWAEWEELDFVRRGDNFGWPCVEGTVLQSAYTAYQPANPAFPICSSPLAGTLRAPMLAWHHSLPWVVSPPGIHFDADGAAQSGGFLGNCAIAGAIPGASAYPAAYAGRMFFADYGQRFVKTLAFDAQTGNASAVYDFGVLSVPLVDLETHPLTGEVWFLTYGATTSQLARLRYGSNLTPVALASVAPPHGPLPLSIVADASASYDPEAETPVFTWNFGDGSAPATTALAQHTYAQAGAYTVALDVADSFGAHATWSTVVHAGNAPPLVAIAEPLQGTLVEPPVSLVLKGSADDAEDGALARQWSVDLLHGNHLHPGVFLSTDAEPTFAITSHGEPGESYAYRINLTATDSQGATSSASAWVYPHGVVADPSGEMQPISRVDALFPPQSQGSGNLDIEVIRDKIVPPVGSNTASRQFDTSHGGDQGLDDWIGLDAYVALDPDARFVGVQFQEGLHNADGGWFESLWVEVRANGVWKPVQNLRIAPPYPFALAQQPGFDGVAFESYELWFDPEVGDAIRVRGTPGGSTGYISCAELRARLLTPTPLPGKHLDITTSATVVAHITSLSPPAPTGAGSKGINTIRNGTLPQTGSASALAQFDTQHTPIWAGDDWIGYKWPAKRLLSKLEFQEGLTTAAGGGFDSLQLQAQDELGNWNPIAGVVALPSQPEPEGPSYQRWTFEFPPLFARAIRLYGDPHGALNYISVGELRAFEVQQTAPCGFASYGAGSGPAPLALAASATTGVGLPYALDVGGGSGAGPGALVVGTAPAALPVFGVELLVNPLSWLSVPLAFDASGSAHFGGQINPDAALVGVKLYLQAARFGAAFPTSLQLSNGLALTLCNW